MKKRTNEAPARSNATWALGRRAGSRYPAREFPSFGVSTILYMDMDMDMDMGALAWSFCS